jgi:hypothetical protein
MDRDVPDLQPARARTKSARAKNESARVKQGGEEKEVLRMLASCVLLTSLPPCFFFSSPLENREL